jgi:outer membrane protein OmpA-like peptidoglycan-associated protein
LFAAFLAAPCSFGQADTSAMPSPTATPTATPTPVSPNPGASGPVTFTYRYVKGDKYRFLSTVDEEVYVNHRYSNRSTIQNRIAFEVADAAPDSSWGLLRGSYDFSETLAGATVASITETYDSEFRRDALGVYTIDPQYYMPTVRNVPVFPARALSPGDTWTAPGEERHDLRRVFGIPDPYAIPFDCRYRYEGPVVKDGKNCLLISASYTIFYQPGPPRAYQDMYPVQIAGYSDQKIYWDPALGQPGAYEERFKLIFDWSDGSNIEYRGTASAATLEAKLMDKAAVAADVQGAVAGLPNVKVAPTDKGVTISIEDIKFQPDSALLLPEELAKIARIAAALARYPDRDVLVAGHTALAGTPEGRQKLSEERAQAVASALIAAGAGPGSRFRTIGWGAEKPIADNSTPEGMARNRRVEITILEN